MSTLLISARLAASDLVLCLKITAVASAATVAGISWMALDVGGSEAPALWRTVSLDGGLTSATMHFLHFSWVGMIVAISLVVVRAIARLVPMPQNIRSFLILAWCAYWTVRVYIGAVLEGRMEPGPTLTLPPLVLMPMVSAVVLVYDRLLPIRWEDFLARGKSATGAKAPTP